MSPEQAKGVGVDGRSDQYSLAMAGYHMLTGRIPFGGESLHTVIYKQVFEDPPGIREIRPEVSEVMANAIHRALRKEPDDRFATMEEFASALHPERPVRATGGAMGIASGATSKLTATPTTPRVSGFAPEPIRRRRATVAIAAAAVFLIGGGAMGALWLTGRSDDASAQAGNPSAAERTEAFAAGSPGSSVITDSTGDSGAAATATRPARDTTVAAPQREAPPASQPRPTAVTPAAPEAPRPGLLTIDADPFGTVYVDGVPVGDTPVVRYALTPGPHIVEVRREGYRTVVDTLDVVAGNPYRLNKTLLRQEP
jgi:serine/threonine-protein kinase